jgi:hypothetical protein
MVFLSIQIDMYAWPEENESFGLIIYYFNNELMFKKLVSIVFLSVLPDQKKILNFLK